MKISFQQNGKLDDDGFAIVNTVFTDAQTDTLTALINQVEYANANFRREADLFAIRNLLGEIPALQLVLWNSDFNAFINSFLGEDYFLTKAIYFNKPPLLNWLVAWHQDTKISIAERKETEGFRQWTQKQGLLAVQPTREFLENIITIRIHLDPCDNTNGALRVVRGSHKSGILTDALIQELEKQETICAVNRGGVMIMKPLLLHSSSKSASDKNRRVIHLEFASKELPNGLVWRERVDRHNFR